MKLNVHSDWDRWLSKLLEVTQDYALVLPLWIFAYERLFSDHKIRPPKLDQSLVGNQDDYRQHDQGRITCLEARTDKDQRGFATTRRFWTAG